MAVADHSDPAIGQPGADKTVLLIAYHFPPVRGSSGLQRTLRFARYLPRFGWRPIVLTINPRAYPLQGASAGNEVPDQLEVHRTFGLDAKRHLSFFGRHPRSWAIPDRWASWRFAAVPAAVRLCRERNVDLVWSTFPIATAHLIGMEVARKTGAPWVAEFRDPMWQGTAYPPDPDVNSAWQALERDVVSHASAIVVTSPGAARVYRERYPESLSGQVVVVENGYDEEVFARAEQTLDGKTTASTESAGVRGGPAVLLHSGTVYPSERDPTQLFVGMARLKREGKVDSARLKLVLRASGNMDEFSRQLRQHGIEDIVVLEPGLPYVQALQEMLTVDGLLLLQASNCNEQIPAKLYEYLRARRPIVALTDPAGDTAECLRQVPGCITARLDSATEIGDAILRFMSVVQSGAELVLPQTLVKACSRESRTGELARVFDSLMDFRAPKRLGADRGV